MRRFPPVLLLAMLSVALVPPASGQANVDVTGLGLFGNLEMNRRLAFLSGSPESEDLTLSPVVIEDTAYIILRQINRKGHPKPSVTAKLVQEDGSIEQYTWTLPFENQIPDTSAQPFPLAVEFDCEPGILNYLETVTVEGVEPMDPRTVEGFFLPSGTLFTRKQDLAFTKANLSTRTTRLLSHLRDMGFFTARITKEEVAIDPETGAVVVHLQVARGPLHKVGTVITRVTDALGEINSTSSEKHMNAVYNTAWLRDQRQALLNSFFMKGFPDAEVRTEQIKNEAETSDITRLDIVFHVDTGPRVTFGGVEFQPDDILKASMLKRQVDLSEGDPYNLLAIDEGRRNLLTLGLLNSVELEEEALSDSVRGASYILHPLPRQSLKLRLGWGSYERARAGLRWEQLNLFQRAHRYTFDFKISTKSSNVELNYIVPQFFDKRITGYAQAGHEFREEITYDRSTSTLLFGATRRLEKPDIELAAEYSLEIQDTDRRADSDFASTDQATVSSFLLRAVLDKRDSPLYPTSGYDASITSKTATEFLGGNANFQKLELATSYHKYLGSALYLHVSLRYGAIFSGSPSSDNLPFNERFFSGGETTIRGYIQGEASPIDSSGNLVGAEAYALGNVELEQRIFNNLALVVFWDGLAQNVDLKVAPDNEYLSSAGIGLRLRTPIGPIRLEYGHNLDPRPSDPDGTFHIGVGYPF